MKREGPHCTLSERSGGHEAPPLLTRESAEADGTYPPPAHVRRWMLPKRTLTTIFSYGVAVAVVACALLVMLLIPTLKTHTPFLCFFPAVMTAGWYGGLGPALVASAVSAHYFILPPAASFALTVVTGIQLAGFVAVAVFISLLQSSLRQARARLEERVQARTHELAETNAELEAFAASVAHDLRAPLRGIRGFAQALVDDYGAQLDATGQDFLQRIIRASTRMDTLIQDLLTYSRLSREALPLEPVPLQAAVRAAQAQLSADLQARGAALQLEAPLPVVIAHYPILVQVLVNVLANAIKFTDPGVRPVVTVRADRTEDQVRLWIEDNGIGIPAEYQERIFQPFERLHSGDTYAGTGIGLAIVRRGVERMGGHVGVVSVPGQGSRFWLALRPADEGA
jgi:signal transduction histidine kinase